MLDLFQSLRAIALVGAIGLTAWAGPTNEVPDVFPLRPIELLSSPTAVPMSPLTFPLGWPVQSVDHIAVEGGRVWIAARRWGMTNSGAKLWAFSVAQNRVDPVRGQVEQHEIRGMAASTEGLWLGLDGGAAVIHPRTLMVEPFGAQNGMTTASPIGFAPAGRRWFALSDAGVLFGLKPDGRHWSRLPGVPTSNPRRTERFKSLVGSGDWLATWSDDVFAVRHQGAPEWALASESQVRVSGVTELPEWRCAAGDGDGAFWLGSQLGMHFLVAETGSIEHRIPPTRVVVPGGLGVVVPPGFQPSKAAYDTARLRQAEGIRERMKQRARRLRSAVGGRAYDPVTPSTRLPGPVRSVVRDGSMIWVAAEDPVVPTRTRILLWHGASRKWVAHFSVVLPVKTMAVDESRLWLGNDLSRVPGGAPVLVVDKRLLLNVPLVKWVSDTIPADELGERLAGLPLAERAVLAFFAGDVAKVVELMESAAPTAEGLFLLAFAHDSGGLNQADRREAYIDRLLAEFPESPHAEAVRSLRPKPAGLTTAAPVVAPPVAAPAPAAPLPESVTPAATPSDPAAQILKNLFRRRDTNGDGKIDLQEFRVWRGPDADIRSVDRDGDGTVGLEEFDAILRGASR